MLFIFSLFVFGCDGYLGISSFEPIGNGISISFDYVGENSGNLDMGDGAVINSGLYGLNLNGETILNPAVSDLVSKLAAQNEIVYITAHGSGGGINPPNMIIRPETYSVFDDGVEIETNDIEFGMRFFVSAACLSGRANWEDAVSNNPNLDGVFAYTEITYDVLDNKVARSYMQCLGSYDVDVINLSAWDHHECWKQANVSAGGNFASSWVSIIREPDSGEIIRINNRGVQND
jgi:hypothetical protein